MLTFTINIPQMLAYIPAPWILWVTPTFNIGYVYIYIYINILTYWRLAWILIPSMKIMMWEISWTWLINYWTLGFHGNIMGFRKNNQEYGDFLSQGSTFVSILFWVPPLMETPHLGYETNHFLEIFHGLMHDSVLVCIYIIYIIIIIYISSNMRCMCLKR